MQTRTKATPVQDLQKLDYTMQERDPETHEILEKEFAGQWLRSEDWSHMKSGRFSYLNTNHGIFYAPRFPEDVNAKSSEIYATHRSMLRKLFHEMGFDPKKLKVYGAGEMVIENIEGSSAELLQIDNRSGTFLGTTAVHPEHLVDTANKFLKLNAPIRTTKKDSVAVDLSEYLTQINHELRINPRLHATKLQIDRAIVAIRNCVECQAIAQEWQILMRDLRHKFPHTVVPSQPDIALIRRKLHQMASEIPGTMESVYLDLAESTLKFADPERYDVMYVIGKSAQLSKTDRESGLRTLKKVMKIVRDTFL